MKTLVGVALGILAFTTLAGAQSAGAEKTAAEAYKNVVVLRDTPESQFLSAMNIMAGSLGVACTYCHAQPYEGDTKPTKVTARAMIKMTREINAANFGGKTVVTCNTCHQGSAHPVGTVAVWNKTPEQVAAFKRAQESAAKPVAPSATPAALPSVEQVLAKYRKAVGGEAKSMHMAGTMKPDLADSRPIDTYAVFPDKLSMGLTISGNKVRLVATGGRAWQMGPGISQELPPTRVVQAVDTLNDLLRSVKFVAREGQREVIGMEKIGDRTYVRVDTTTALRVDRLYFDEQTGLLYKVRTEQQTPLGLDPNELVLEDYREVGGMKLPFQISNFVLSDRIVYKFSTVEPNVTIDPAKFEPPAAKPPAAK